MIRAKAYLYAVVLACLVLAAPLVSFAQKSEALPYEPGEGLIIKSGEGYNFRLSGFVQPMVESRRYPSMDTLGSFERFRMRRLVTRLTGNFEKYNLQYQLQVDLTGSSDAGGDAGTNNYLMDAWIAWRPIKTFEITFGQDNPATDSREMGMLSNTLQMLDRSPVSLAFSSIREFGVFMNYRHRLGGNFYVQPHLMITNGDGANVFNKDRGGLKYGGRIDIIPFGTFSRVGMYRQMDIEREQTPKLVFGAAFSYNVGISDRRGRESGEIIYRDANGKETLPDYRKWVFDFLFKYKGFTAYGEYITANTVVPSTITQRVRNDGSVTSSFLVNGVQDINAYINGRIITGSGANIQMGYLFMNGFSIDGRYSRLMPETNSFLNNPTFNNRSEFYALSVSKFLGRNYGARIQGGVSYVRAQPGTSTVLGTTITGNELVTGLMLTLAL